MNLDDIVPPLELCKLIPAGEFEDSALCWIDIGHTFVLSIDGIPPEQHPFVELRRYTINGDEISAPTLQEILVALPPYGKNEKILACRVPDWANFDARIFGEHWRVGYTGDCSINDKNPATAALKLWLKLKGIEDGK